MAQDFAQFARKVEAIERDLTGETSKAQMVRVGLKLRKEIDQAVRVDLGDLSMSGWRRSGPIEITGTSRALDDHAVIIEPVKAAKGPMAVRERGRNVGNGSAMQGPGVSADGSTRRNKSGALRKVRARKAKRWNGYTQGKGTMSEASQGIKREAPKLIEREVQAALAKHLTRG